MSIRRGIAIALVVAGSLLAAGAIALTANMVWALTQPPPSELLVDVYYVLPSPWITVVVFAVGVLGDLVLWARAATLGRRATLIWRTHLVLTTALLVAWLIAGAATQLTMPVAMVIYAAFLLMFAAHGAALAAAAMILRRS